MKLIFLMGLLLIVSQCEFIGTQATSSPSAMLSSFMDYTKTIISNEPSQTFKICEHTASKNDLEAVLNEMNKMNQKIAVLTQN